MRALRNVKFLALAILSLIAIGTAGFHLIEGWPLFDGFYMVVTTFTTIGYQEVLPLSHAGRIINVFLIGSGVALVFLLIGSLTQVLIESEFQQFFGRRKMEREIGRLTDHYIICGAGRVGHSVANELAAELGPLQGASAGVPAPRAIESEPVARTLEPVAADPGFGREIRDLREDVMPRIMKIEQKMYQHDKAINRALDIAVKHLPAFKS